MKQLGKLIPLFLLCLGLLGCNNDPFVEEGSGGNATVKEISVTLPEIPSDVVTRTEFMMSVEGAHSTWAENDTIGIFPQKGNQVAFPMSEGAGSSTAIFDGGGWELKPSYAYAAYYPFSKANYLRNNKIIPIDYTGQTQEGNGNSAHLGPYDYMASGQVSPNSSGTLNLQMQRLGSLVMLEMVVPQSDYTSLTLSSSGAKFIKKAELDISGAAPQIIEKETSSTITLALNEISLETNDTLRAYLMCAPVDLTSGTLSVELSGKIIYTTEFEPKNLEAGKLYKFSCSTFSPVGNIKFASSIVKQICVSTWDTNKDGELSYEEAARVTSIPTELFKEKAFTSFDELVFFTNLQRIGYDAFNGCNRLTSITLPDRVTYIGSSAFYGCSSLTSINIPEGVTEIEASAFRNCSSLTSITLPEGVTSLGRWAFSGCSSLTSINIPDGVTFIDWETFSGCSSLTSITLPEGVTGFGPYAFKGCNNLTSINIPNGVTGISDGTFYDCSSLTSINIPDRTTAIGYNTFNGCSSLTSISLPSGVTVIGDSTFYSCSSLTSITLPDELTSIGSQAFNSCSSLTSITLPDKLTSIEDSTFMDCSSLISITCTGNNPPTIGSNVFESTNNCPIYVPASSVESYKAVWYRYADRILANQTDDFIEFADPLVKQICVSQWDTNKDGELSYEEAYAVAEIPRRLFYEKTITSFDELIYFTNLNVIREYAFYGCSGLTSITIPKSVTSIEGYAFSSCSSLTSITLPSGVTSIDEYVFSDCSSLTSFTLPSGVTSIGESAFSGCSYLTYINIPEGVTEIGEEAFYDCHRLTSIYIPGGVTSINKSTFKNCSMLTNIIISTGVTEIGVSAFESCIRLTSITLPEGVTSIGSSAFYLCSELTSINIPDGVTYIGTSTFQGCNNLSIINIPDGVTEIGSNAFKGCYKLTSINIPDGVTKIGEGAFSYSGLTSIIIPNGVTEIISQTFYNCGNLTSVTLPNGLKYIGGVAFTYCGLTSITIPEGVTSISQSAFYGCGSLTNITCCANEPPYLDEYTFDETSNCPIYVPASSVETYKTAHRWSNYADRIQAIQ